MKQQNELIWATGRVAVVGDTHTHTHTRRNEILQTFQFNFIVTMQVVFIMYECAIGVAIWIFFSPLHLFTSSK